MDFPHIKGHEIVKDGAGGTGLGAHPYDVVDRQPGLDGFFRWLRIKLPIPVQAGVADEGKTPLYAAIDGLDYPTIAGMLGIPLGTVKTLIFRGKRMLREEISLRLRVPYGS